MRRRLLDLFCGAGGGAKGYHDAGFDVVGVDIDPQPNYPFEFLQMDALDALRNEIATPNWWGLFDVIHASPPCKRFTTLAHMWNRKEHPDLLTPTREILSQLATPWVIENVVGAPMYNYVTLCGTSFGLGTDTAELWRHRQFESNFEWPLFVPGCAHGQCSRVIGVYGGHGRDRRRRVNTQDFSTEDRREAMGIDWMTGDELSQAIPPAYTRWIGERLIEQLQVAA